MGIRINALIVYLYFNLLCFCCCCCCFSFVLKFRTSALKEPMPGQLFPSLLQGSGAVTVCGGCDQALAEAQTEH